MIVADPDNLVDAPVEPGEIGPDHRLDRGGEPLAREMGIVEAGDEPGAVGIDPARDSRPVEQSQHRRRVGRLEPVGEADRAVGIEKRAAVECGHWTREAQGCGQLQHAARRARADQGGRHSGRGQAEDRIAIGVGQALVVAHERPVDVRHEQPDRFGRRLAAAHVSSECQARPSRASNASAASGPLLPAL